MRPLVKKSKRGMAAARAFALSRANSARTIHRRGLFKLEALKLWIVLHRNALSTVGIKSSVKKVQPTPIRYECDYILRAMVQVIEKKYDASVERIVDEFSRVAFCDPAEIVDAQGNLLPLKEMPPHVRAAVQSIKVHTDVDDEGKVSHIPEVKFWPKVAALDGLAKYRKMFVQLHEHGKPGDFDHLSDDEVSARLQALRGINKASDAARLENKTKTSG